LKFSRIIPAISKLKKKIYNSKYYSLFPLHNKHKVTAFRDRYRDCFDVLFGMHREDQPLRFGVLDYLTFGIFQVLNYASSPALIFRLVYQVLYIVKMGAAYILALPLMVIRILATPLFFIMDLILTTLFLNMIVK